MSSLICKVRGLPWRDTWELILLAFAISGVATDDAMRVAIGAVLLAVSSGHRIEKIKGSRHD